MRDDLLQVGPLQRRLFAIVLVGLLPLALLSFAILLHIARANRDQVITANENTVRAVLTAVEAEIALSASALDALASSPRLARGDWAGFHVEALDLLSRRPAWANIVLSTPDARQVVNARVPYGSPLPTRVDPATIASVATTRQSAVGRVILAPIGEYAFAVGVPVMRGDQVAYVLTAPVRPDSIRAVLDRQRITPPVIAAVLDDDFHVVARSIGHDESVGKPASKSLLDLLRTRSEGRADVTTSLDGVPVYTIYKRSDVIGWTVAMGIPTETLDAPVRRAYLALGGAILLSVALGLVAALFAAQSVTRPMRELRRAAAALGRGEVPAMPATALAEVRDTADALVAAHAEREHLLQSEREARTLERDARLAAENASRAKDQFLAMLGHELRNPLAAITTAAYVLERSQSAPTGSPAANATTIIRRQSAHLARMTDDLLDAGRVMLGKITLRRTPVELGEQVRNVVATLRSSGRLDGHRVDVTADPAWVDGDSTRLEQVIGNLVTNAIKYSHPGGRIGITVARDAGDAVVRVRDTGIGIDPALLDRIFDLFVQGPQSADRAAGGLGIGLALVRRLVELHGGSVEAASGGEGQGSTFVVRLPAIEPPARVEVAPPDQAPAAPLGRKVLVVEDNEDARRMLRQLLELEGHEVHEAADGISGVEAILRERPDVAVIDIGLPRLDGYQVAATVRAQLGRAIRLIALTGYGQREDSRRGVAAGYDAFLVKPIDPATLTRALFP